ncbi:MAG: hypothetical protein MHM6MM_003461 [Cercozoa sp. M6MM]
MQFLGEMAFFALASGFLGLIARDQATFDSVGQPVRVLAKTAPIWSLLVLLLFQAARSQKVKSNRLVYGTALGLLFGSVGDVSLDLDTSGKTGPMFLVGLVAFLISHICYGVALFNVRQPMRPMCFSLLSVVMCGYYMTLQRHLPEQMLLPVAIYASAILGMTVIADGSGLVRARIGAVLFCISDATLAWDAFAVPFERSRLIVMTTYYLAQYFIAKAALASVGAPSQRESAKKSN